MTFRRLPRGRMLSEEGRPRVIVCGTRTFDDWPLLCRVLDKKLQHLENPIMVLGGGRNRVWVGGRWKELGADYYAEQWARRKLYLMKIFRVTDAEWKKQGPSAGPRRNADMVSYAGARRPAYLIAFWDGKSPGTKDCLQRARKAGFKTAVIYYRGE